MIYCCISCQQSVLNFIDYPFMPSPIISREDQSVYTKALSSGSIPVNRYRLMVVGKDGAGKSCFIDSLLDRPFKPANPSTDGIAIDVAVTAAEGRKGHVAWAAHEVHEGQYLDQYFAAGYVISRKREETVRLIIQ